jgi:ATP-binding protein involved in chromosome partitioning
VPLVGVVENMSYLICPKCGEQIEVFHRSKREWAVEDEELELLGRVPMDIDISKGIDAGHPLVEESPASGEAHVFREIARRVAGKMGE